MHEKPRSSPRGEEAAEELGQAMEDVGEAIEGLADGP